MVALKCVFNVHTLIPNFVFKIAYTTEKKTKNDGKDYAKLVNGPIRVGCEIPFLLVMHASIFHRFKRCNGNIIWQVSGENGNPRHIVEDGSEGRKRNLRMGSAFGRSDETGVQLVNLNDPQGG